MAEISIILPSLRPEMVLKRINEFSVTNPGADYEIVVVSPFAVKGDRVVHIEEEPMGCVHAHNTAYKNSSGKYIAYWGDRATPTANCLSEMLNFIKSNTDPFIGSFRLKDDKRGRERTQWAIYGKLFAAFGCASRKTIEIAGGYFDPIFKAWWVDPDLCLRAWERGGKVKICPNAWITIDISSDKIAGDNWSKYFLKDQETFFNRWHNKLGRGIKKDHDTVFIPFGKAQVIGFLPSFIRPALFNQYGFWKKLPSVLYSWTASIPYLKKIKRRFTTKSREDDDK